MHEVRPQRDEGLESREDEADSFLERWLLPYVQDSMLWPVLLVIIAHVVAFVAPVLLFALREHRPISMLTIVLFVYFTVVGVRYEMRVRSRFGAFSWVLVITWALSIVAAWFADLRGFL